MKRVSAFLIAAIVLFPLYTSGQRTCATNEVFLEQLSGNPQLTEKIRQIEQHTQAVMSSPSKKVTGIVTIPVHVIVVYARPEENVSYAQIESQISALNEDFRKLNSDWTLTPDEFLDLVSDVEIQFTLASIERHSNPHSSWGTSISLRSTYPAYAPKTHLNIWVCNIGGGILGYAQFPGGDPSTDGIVISYRYFGSNEYDDSFNLHPRFDKGRTATHEVGHWLNLRHIWGDGPCGATDFVDDTPDASQPYSHCPNYPQASCNSNDMFMNYMDYVDDDCMFMFSNGQKERMRAVFEPGGPRYTFISGIDSCEIEACDGNINLTLKLGDNPWDVSWILTKADGTLIDYTQDDYRIDERVAASWNLAAGQYLFTIYDSHSNGICCPSGNGSYSLTDGCGNTLLSGDSSDNYEWVNFCVPGDSSVITLPPTKIRDDRELIPAENDNLSTSSEKPGVTNEIKLYPNPAFDKLTIDLDDGNIVSAKIYTSSGVLVKSYLLENGFGRIDIGYLKPGLYLLKLNINTTIRVVKFLKE